MIRVFSLKLKAGHFSCALLPEVLSVFFRPREKGSASMDAVDINRLAQPSRQAQCGLARITALDSCFGYKVSCRSQIFSLGHLVEFGRLMFF